MAWSAVMVGIIIFVFFMLSGGVIFILFMRNDGKSETWKALCYQVGDGIRSIGKDKDGNPVNEFQLKDLKPYTKDTIEKIDEKYGITVYKLRTLKMTTGQVTADHVEVWSGEKVVHVLINNGSATLMKKGYDEATANKIYSPMKRDRLEMLKSEILIKQKRLDPKKDRVEKIVALVMFGFAIMGLIGVTYLTSSGWVKSAELNKEAMGDYGVLQIEASENYKDAARQMAGLAKEKEGEEESTLGKQPQPEPPPSIE